MNIKEFSAELREWSREVVNHHMRKDPAVKGSYKYVYSIRIHLEPNPLDFDGIDSIEIELIRREQRTKSIEVVQKKHFSCCRLDEVIAIVKANKDFLN